jgi:hypothetical protein
MPSPTPVPSHSVLLNFPFVDTLGPILAFVLQIIALLGAVYGFIRGIQDVIGWLRRPRLKFYMSDDLWPVAEQNHSQFAINIQLVAYNPGRRMAALRRLEASLIRPAFNADRYPQKTFALVWRRFITGSPSEVEETEPVFVKAVTPKDSVVLAVQLRGNYDETDSFHDGHFDWFPGQYTFHLYGLINRRRMRLSPRSGFKFELSNTVSGQLSPVGDLNARFTRSVQLKQDDCRFWARMVARIRILLQ